MNWTKLKEKFPNSCEEIREFAKANNTDGAACMYYFLRTKGFNPSPSWMSSLKLYEKWQRKQ